MLPNQKLLIELTGELGEAAAAPLRRELVSASPVGSQVDIGGRRVTDFTSWDYLGLASSASLKRAVHEAVELFGVSPSSARLSAGTLPVHEHVERKLSKFLGTEASLLFSSKTQAFLTLVSALVGERDVIICDELSLSPVLDAAYLVHATVRSVNLHQIDSVSAELDRCRTFRRRLVLLESPNGATGEVVDVKGVLGLCARTDSVCIVDESIALGMLGVRGAGASEGLALESRPFALLGDLGRALCGSGGFVSGPSSFIDLLVQRSRALALEVAPPVAIACVSPAVDAIERAIEGRQAVLEVAKVFREALRAAGVPVAGGEDSFLLSVPCPTLAIARSLFAKLLQLGVLVDVVSSPAPLSAAAFVRFVFTSRHAVALAPQLADGLAPLFLRR